MHDVCTKPRREPYGHAKESTNVGAVTVHSASTYEGVTVVQKPHLRPRNACGRHGRDSCMADYSGAAQRCIHDTRKPLSVEVRSGGAVKRLAPPQLRCNVRIAVHMHRGVTPETTTTKNTTMTRGTISLMRIAKGANVINASVPMRERLYGLPCEYSLCRCTTTP